MNSVRIDSVDNGVEWDDKTKVERAAVFTGRGPLMVFVDGDDYLLANLETGYVVARRKETGKYYLGDELVRVASDCDVVITPR